MMLPSKTVPKHSRVMTSVQKCVRKRNDASTQLSAELATYCKIRVLINLIYKMGRINLIRSLIK